MPQQRMAMYSRAYAELNRPRCPFCGVELTPHQAASSGICDSRVCHERKLEQVGTELLARRRREALERLFEDAAPSVAAAAEAVGGTPETVVRAALPRQGRPVVPLPDERRAAFEAHLRRIVDEAFAAPPPYEDPAAREWVEQEERPPLPVACTLCQGECCARGGTTAMLTKADIARWRRRDPTAAAEAIVDWYLGHVPEETTEDACVFQGRDGCALPRARRSDWCNRWQCKPREELQAATGGPGRDRVVMIAARDGEPRAVISWSPATGPVEAPLVLAEGADGAAQDSDEAP